ncbi:VOC family protein [Salipiger sp. P9]|uniref:VOC family protein n=1 Tax=Salipiger pentaromativorans TaxID=2943193 RepID=UPI0021571CB4|nr:VOC family protein [Salipiger pentaromativorans]MCR8546661.1 VOC family protein [Salipiger pentaromativorans]
MKLQLDHIAVLGESLEEAVAHAEAAAGVPLLPGGTHPRYGTHNQLLGLGRGLYLEALAIDPAAPPPEGARWFGLDRFAGPARLDKWICRVSDMEAALKLLPMAGKPVTLSRGRLRWIMSVPEDGMLPFDGVFPALIQWLSPVPAGAVLSASGTVLERLAVVHPEAAALEALLAPVLDAPLVSFQSGPAGLRAELRTAQGHLRVLQ